MFEMFFFCSTSIVTRLYFDAEVMVLLQVIPRQLCDNAGFDATDVLNKLRQKHALPSGWLAVVLCEYLITYILTC